MNHTLTVTVASLDLELLRWYGKTYPFSPPEQALCDIALGVLRARLAEDPSLRASWDDYLQGTADRAARWDAHQSAEYSARLRHGPVAGAATAAGNS